MAFFKFRSRGPQANEGRNTAVSAAPAESVEALRRRARHRLLGAAILLLVGVIGFPLLFDTQPRPVAVDIPIEIPDRNKTAPLTLPPTARTEAPAASGSRVAQAPPSSSSSGIITETQDGAEISASTPVTRAPAETRATPAPAPAPKPEAVHKSESKPEPKPEVRAETKPKPKAEPTPEPAPKPQAKPATADDGARARALLDGQGAAAARQVAAAPAPAAASDANGRFVIQVGAFADAAKAREVRQKLERAGLKTYTNVAKTADGERTRVRVGPFQSRAEADQAAGKVKGLALPAAVLGL